MQVLDELPYAQRERLAYIDFCLNYFGSITRAALIERFGIGPAAATRDFGTYKEFCAGNLVLRPQNKVYERTPAFKPLFDHEPTAALFVWPLVLAMASRNLSCRMRVAWHRSN